MHNGSQRIVLVAFGFPQQHAMLVSLLRHAEIIEHQTTECALAAAVSQSANGALLCSNSSTDDLMTLAARWQAHPVTKYKPLVLTGCDGWKEDEFQLANSLTVDSYLPSNVSADLVLGAFTRLSTRINGLLEKDPSAGSGILPTLNEKLEDILRKQAFDQTSSITQIAHDAGMSLSRFQRTVKRLTGRTPVEYINYVRLVRARRLLATKSGTVSDIAYQCGFNSVAYFCKQYKREFGQTPGETMT